MMHRAHLAASFLGFLFTLGGCGAKEKFDPVQGAPPPAKVEEIQDVNTIEVDHPERFPIATATEYSEDRELNATGVVSPDVSRTIPVVSLASGRVVGIFARLGDDVKKGQLLIAIQSADLSTAFSDYSKAQADEQLSKTQLEREQLLYNRGAIAMKELEVAQDTEQKAKVDLQNAAEHIRILGADVGHPAAVVNVYAPVSGTIVEQNVTQSAGVKTLDNSPNLFTIADLSRVWILCDVYENDLPSVKLGDRADVRLTAYPNRVLHARVGNIGRVLDPNTRTVKVRLEMQNPGLMAAGMFVTAIFHGQRKELVAAVPVTAILHLHDQDWVFTPLSDGKFRRVHVASGNRTGDGMQEVIRGIAPGQQVVKNALQLSTASEQ